MAGVCMAGGGDVCGGGHAWQGACMVGVVCGRGPCVVGEGTLVAGGMCGRGCVWYRGCITGGHVWQGVCMAGGMHGTGEHVWQGGMHGMGAWREGVCGMHVPPPQQILRDTVNERAVHILLECILVIQDFAMSNSAKSDTSRSELPLFAFVRIILGW